MPVTGSALAAPSPPLAGGSAAAPGGELWRRAGARPGPAGEGAPGRAGPRRPLPAGGGVAAGRCPVQGAGPGALGAASIRPEPCRCAGRVRLPPNQPGADGAEAVREGGRSASGRCLVAFQTLYCELGVLRAATESMLPAV